MFDPNHHYFPEFGDPSMVMFLIPFGRLMFGYANLDREIADIVSVATGKHDFIRRDASKVSSQVEDFIVKHVGMIAEMKSIKEQLDRSIKLYHLRNDLAHGHWWRFDPSSESLEIRRDRCRDGEQFVTVTRADVEQAADEFEDVEVELYKIRRAIEARQIQKTDIVASADGE